MKEWILIVSRISPLILVPLSFDIPSFPANQRPAEQMVLLWSGGCNYSAGARDMSDFKGLGF